MRPFYFSTKAGSNNHPLVDSMLGLYDDIQLFIENHTRQYNFEQIAYFLNPDFMDYKQNCQAPIKNTEVEFVNIEIDNILDLMSSINYIDDSIFITNLTNRDNYYYTSDCVDEKTIAYYLGAKFKTHFKIDCHGSEKTTFLYLTEHTCDFNKFKKFTQNVLLGIKDEDSQTSWDKLLLPFDIEKHQLEYAKAIEHFKNKDIVYVGYDKLNEEFIQFFNPKRLFTIKPFFTIKNKFIRGRLVS